MLALQLYVNLERMVIFGKFSPRYNLVTTIRNMEITHETPCNSELHYTLYSTERIKSIRFNGTLALQSWLSIVPSCEHVIRINKRVYEEVLLAFRYKVRLADDVKNESSQRSTTLIVTL